MDRPAGRTWCLSTARSGRNRRFDGISCATLSNWKALLPDHLACHAAASGTSARTALFPIQRPRIFDRPSMEDDMLYWALVFFIIAIIAAFFGFVGVAATAVL